MASWRIAQSLQTLRSQCDQIAPKRSKANDGTIGDSKHAASVSDHNPDKGGVVRALDITHSPATGLDAHALADRLVASKDPRIKYVISRGRIANATVQPWQWRKYTGDNPHDAHCHVSVVADARADDPKPFAAVGAAPVVTAPVTPGTDRRSRMGRLIAGYEARRDAAGHIVSYTPADGSIEVAGINSRVFPEQAKRLRDMSNAGQHAEVEASAAEFILKYTDGAASWTTNAGVEFYLRDCIFNRGPTGATGILQMALGVLVDHVVGPITREALSKIGPADLLAKLRQARERYELQHYGKRAALWQGLVNRWDNALRDAKAFALETPTATNSSAAATAGTAAAGGTGAAVAVGVQAGWGWLEWGIFAAVLIGLAASIYLGWRWYKNRKPKPLAMPTPIATPEEALQDFNAQALETAGNVSREAVAHIENDTAKFMADAENVVDLRQQPIADSRTTPLLDAAEQALQSPKTEVAMSPAKPKAKATTKRKTKRKPRTVKAKAA